MATTYKPEAFIVPTGIVQRVSAGNFFDGALPAADPASNDINASNGCIKYPVGTVGGLFIFGTNEPIFIPQIQFILNGNANATISIVNLNHTTGLPIAGEEFTIYEATAVSQLFLDETKLKFMLLNRQALRIVTTASGGAQLVQVIARLERGVVR